MQSEKRPTCLDCLAPPFIYRPRLYDWDGRGSPTGVSLTFPFGHCTLKNQLLRSTGGGSSVARRDTLTWLYEPARLGHSTGFSTGRRRERSSATRRSTTKLLSCLHPTHIWLFSRIQLVYELSVADSNNQALLKWRERSSFLQARPHRLLYKSLLSWLSSTALSASRETSLKTS